MENTYNIIHVDFKGERIAQKYNLWQYDYNQILQISGLSLPAAVEIHFSLTEKSGKTETRVVTTKNGITQVQIPNELLRNDGKSGNYSIFAFIYVVDEDSGNTEYEIILHVKSRPAPGEIGEDPEEKRILDEAVEMVNQAADRAETAERGASDQAAAAEQSKTDAAESAETAKKYLAETEEVKEETVKELTELSESVKTVIADGEESIAEKQTLAEKSITDHTDTEIARLDRETQASEERLTETIRTANNTAEAVENTASEARRAKESLDASVRDATETRETVAASVRTANAAKKNLDQSTADANVAKTALDKTIQSADDQNASLGEKIETSKQLKTDLQTAGEKAVKDIQTAGSEQLGKMQAVAEEFTADREQITTNKEDIGSLKEDTVVLQKRQNVLVGSETGNPISCDDAFAAPLCGLTVYGRSTQDGTPSPDNPVPIVSAGDGGSVAVKVTGANILEGTKPGVKSTVLGITYTTYENGVLITGTAADISSMRLHEDKTHRLTRGIYYLTTKGLSPSVTLNFFFVGRFSSDIQNKEITLTRNVDYSLMLQILKGATLNTTVQVALTRNKIATYSPYREQLLTLPTPTGLPGIPVTSGGNYTDQSGQQWVCDEVDFGKSVKVQRVYKVDVDGENAKFVQATTYANLSLRGLPKALYDVGQKIFASSTFTSLPWFFNTTNGQFLYLVKEDISDQLNESCKKQLGKVYYALATPIETPLTPAEIAAYKAITAYAPDTVVQASDDIGVKLEYQRDVNIAIKNLEDAIASMTTT